MKTNLLFATMLLCFVGLSSKTNAQTAFEWDFHGIGFEVASDFNVQANNESEFTAVSSDGIIAVTLLPWSDATVSMDHLAEATISTAEQLATFDRAEIDGDAIDLGDLEGYFIVAATDDYESYDFLLVALLLDVESSTNLVVAIGFMDGNEDEAIDILGSIYAYD